MRVQQVAAIISALILGIGSVMAQSDNKMISKKLDGVVVEAENQKITPQVATYFPTQSQKNVARNATSLLGMMAIPQLNVDLSSNQVTTLDGQSVRIFINYIEASSYDLEGLKTTDVRRVEYYTYPTDPRFKGASHVVNLIIHKYLYGGYTKLTAEKQFDVNRTNGFVYSKMSYKKMTYDLYAGDRYLTTRHNGSDIMEELRFSDLYGNGPSVVSRRSSTTGSRLRDNTCDLVFRATYAGQKSQLSNKISMVLNNKPVNESVSTVTYTPSIFPSGYASQSNNTRNLTAAYNGDYFFKISDRISLQTDLRYTYGHNSSNYGYVSGEGFSITNDAMENSNSLRFNPRLSYSSGKHRMMTYFTGAWNTNRIDYSGSTSSRESYNVQAYFAGLHYDYVIAKLQTGADLSWGWESNRISGIKSTNNFPVLVAYANYMPARKHMLSLSFNYGADVPDASQKSPNMLQQNELMWVTGSADLKDYSFLSGNLNYTWLPNNKWQFSASSAYSRFSNRCVAVYTPTAPEGTMLRHYVNGGEYSAGMLAVNATARFLGNRLIINIMPQMWFYHTSGVYRNNLHDLNGRFQTSYYHKNFFFSGTYTLKRKYPATQAEYREKVPEQYQLQMGWGNGRWNLTLTASNFLRNSWESSRQVLSSEWYDFTRINNSTLNHRKFEFSVRYTFSYGKKVDQRNEVNKGESTGSAILK